MQSLNDLTRREFVRAAFGSAVTAAVSNALPLAAGADKPKPWTVAIRDAHLKATGQPDCWAALRALDVAGLEVEVNEDMLCYSLFHPAKKHSLAGPEGWKALQEDLATHGATITAFCMHNRLDERLERELDWTRRLVQAAARLQVDVIRIDVWPRKLRAEEFLPFAIKACRQMCDLAEGTRVKFGIENHGRITNDPAFLDQLFEGVGSPRLGLTLDAMNFYWFGHPLDDLYGIYEKLAPRVFHTHCKNLRYPADKKNTRRPMGWEYEKHAAPLYEGDIDYRRVTAILRQAGYPGDLCLENECLGRFPAAERAAVLKKEIALLKSLA